MQHNNHRCCYRQEYSVLSLHGANDDYVDDDDDDVCVVANVIQCNKNWYDEGFTKEEKPHTIHDERDHVYLKSLFSVLFSSCRSCHSPENCSLAETLKKRELRANELPVYFFCYVIFAFVYFLMSVLFLLFSTFIQWLMVITMLIAFLLLISLGSSTRTPPV